MALVVGGGFFCGGKKHAECSGEGSKGSELRNEKIAEVVIAAGISALSQLAVKQFTCVASPSRLRVTGNLVVRKSGGVGWRGATLYVG